MQSFQQFHQKSKPHTERLKKKFANTKVQTFTYNLNLLKHQLKIISVRLNYLSKTNERKCINRQVTSKSKAVYHSFCNTNTTVKEIPTSKEVESYWTNIWEKSKL